MGCVEVVAHGVVVGRGGDYDEVGVAVSLCSVERCGEVELLFGEVFLDILVLNGRAAVVDEVDFFGNHVDCCYAVVLREQRGDGETDVSGPGNCYVHFPVGLKFWVKGGLW